MGPLSRLTFTCGLLFTTSLMIGGGCCGLLKGKHEIGYAGPGFQGKWRGDDEGKASLAEESNQVEYTDSSSDYNKYGSSSEEDPDERRNQLAEASDKLHNTDCRSNDDCSPNYCCSLGMTRYAVATCLPLGRSGDPCIPENGPRNFTLSYPNGKEVEVINTFRITCPCAQNYFCDSTSVTCKKSSHST